MPKHELTCAEQHLLARVAALLEERLADQGLHYRDVPVERSVLSRAVRTGRMRLTTLARISEALGLDLVVNFRERRPAAPPVHPHSGGTPS
jgi:uncharacterized ferritin-like protein (DUF455 family)